MATSDEPVCVISGWVRSGTSMLMQALEAGGMRARYRTVPGWRDEDPTDLGLRELPIDEMRRADFPRGYEGCLIKWLGHGPETLKPELGIEVRSVFMMRDPEEIRDSWMRRFGSRHPERREAYEHAFDPALIAAQRAAAYKAQQDHPMIAVASFWYEEVRKFPLVSLGEIAEFYGYPLDLEAAAATILPLGETPVHETSTLRG